MTLKTSLIITGDSRVAQQAVDDLKKSVDNLATGSRNAANSQGAVAVATEATAASARGAAVAQGAVATANTTVAATSRAAAVAQGAVAVATNAATGAMSAFGISAMTVEAILTGGLSLALTAGIGFLAGFAGEMFSAGGAADEAAGKVDRMTEALARLRKEKATPEDVGIVEGKMNDLRDERMKASISIDLAANTRAGAQQRSIATRRIAEIDAELGTLGRSITMNEAVAQSHEKVTEVTNKSTAATRTHTRARQESSGADREAAAAQKQLQAELSGAIARYDPARKAASDYADELERIAKLAATKGKDGKPMLSAEDAANFKAQASANYLGKAIDLGGIKDAAEVEQGAINAAGAIDKLVQSIHDEGAALTALTPIQRVMIQYHEQLNKLPPEARAAAAQRIVDEQAATDAIKDQAEATRDAQRAQEQLQGAAIAAFADIVVGGQKAGDVVDRLAQSIASAAVEATLFGTGPMAALLGGGVADSVPDPTVKSAQGTGAADLVAKSVGKEIKEAMHGVFGDKGSFGKTLRNAGLGYAAGGLTGSRTGGAIGGAIGGEVGEELLTGALGKLGKFAGPIGAIAGGLLGGAIGGLLKKTQTGAANITSVDDAATISGNNSGFKKAAGGAAGSIQEGLASIAEQFGGSTGAFNVTIGQRHGDWRVRTGSGSLKIAKGATEFDDDQAGAIAYGMQLAIAQGAITGLSAAVQKAINSSTDLDKALAEALKVQEVETLVGGIGGALQREFKDLDRQAKERVRIAQQYGFDVLAIEKKNAEERAALTEQMQAAQTGSLQRLLDEMTSGSLFEGSGADQRTALLAQIEKTKADLEAGKDGAADTLANLYSNLNAVSKEYFGATGQFAADRSMIVDEARAAISRSNAQIEAAAKASDPALATTNQALDENNDQNAQIIAALQTLPADIASYMVRGNVVRTIDAAELARTS